MNEVSSAKTPDWTALELLFIFWFLMWGVFIASWLVNRKNNQSSTPTSWMKGVRRFQDKRMNQGWRIRLIANEDDRPLVINPAGLWQNLAFIGCNAFILGIAALVYDEQTYGKLGILVGLTGLALLLCSGWRIYQGSSEDRLTFPAYCIDRELKEIPLGLTESDGSGWFCRIVCEYDCFGQKYQVTPIVHRVNFSSEMAALKFLEEKISADGRCILRVSLKNPFQAELV